MLDEELAQQLAALQQQMQPQQPQMQAPQTPQQGLLSAQPATSGNSTGAFYDPAKLKAAQEAMAAGADGRKVLSGDAWLGVLNPLQGLTQTITPGMRMVYDSQSGQLNSMGDMVSFGADRKSLEDSTHYKDAQGRMYQVVGRDANGNAQVQFTDNSGGGWENPTGSSRDRIQPTYQLDAQGNATPISAGSSYKPSGWVDYGRDIAKMVAAAATAYVGGTALAASGAGAGGGAGAAAGAAGGGLDVAGLTALDSAAYAGAGEGFLTGGAAAAGATEAGVAAGNGAFLGEGIASGIPAWDAAYTGAGGLLSGGGGGLLDSIKAGNWGDALKAGGSGLVDWVTKNPGTALQLGSLLGGAVAGGSGGSGSGGGGSNYTPQPVDRGGWQSSVTPQYTQAPTQQPAGLLANPQGQANDGLWRYNKTLG